MGLQLVLEAELLAAAVTFVGLLARVDALVALQRALVAEAAPAELALVRVVAGWGQREAQGNNVHIHVEGIQLTLSSEATHNKVHLTEEREAIYRCRYSKDVHGNK